MKTPDLQGLSSRPVADCTSAEVAAAFTRSFEGYVVPLRFTPEAYERRFRGEDLDPYDSRVYERDGAPAGVVLIARRGWTSRVAAMGIAPELRGCGVGRQVMAAAIAEARARGERTMILEVIDGNATFEAAVQFSKAEGILPAPESAHAVRVAIDEALRARESGEKKVIAFNLSGHGHFDMSAYEQFHQGKLQDHEYPTAMVEEAMAHLPQVTVG